MNIERINLLADTIEHHRIAGLGFNMTAFAQRTREPFFDDKSGHSCGTTACIGGHAVALAHADWTLTDLVAEEDGRSHVLHREARDWLGLTEEQAEGLFYSHPQGVPFSETTPAMAVKTLRHLAATGEVDWNAA